MKKSLIITLIISIVLILAACSNAHNKVHNNPTGTDATTEEPEQPSTPDATIEEPVQPSTPDATPPTESPSDNNINDNPTIPSPPTVHKCPPHNYGQWTVTTQATCITNGKKCRTCANCGTVETETIQKSHALVTIPAQAATCTQNGTTGGEKCSVCDTYTKTPTILSATGHNLDSWTIGQDATCTSDGYNKRSCSKCSYTETQPISATGHSMGTWTVGQNASCASAGYNKRSCSKCSHTETQTIPATGHTFGSWSLGQSATCSASGYNQRTCSKCYYVDKSTIPATGEHKYVNGQCSCGAKITGSSFLTYRLSDDGSYYICTGTSSYTDKNEIIIPSYYNGKPVKEVGLPNGTPASFCNTKKLVIMEGIEIIHDFAFYLDRDMKEVYLPNSLKSIGYCAFDYCDNLEYVSISTSGWKFVKKYGGQTESVNMSNPYTAATLLRDKTNGSYER